MDFFLPLILPSIAAILMIIGLLIYLSPESGEKPNAKKIDSRFERINEMEGYLHVEGKKIKTYDIGYFTMNDQVGVRLHSQLDGSVIVMDITMYDQSIFAYAPFGLSHREKADFAIQTLKHSAHQGAIQKSIVTELEEVLLEIDEQNRYIEEGKMKKLYTDDFVWC